MVVVGVDTRDALAGLSAGNVDVLDNDSSGLDGRTAALVKIAVLVALDAPASCYVQHVGNALAEGVTPEDILAVLHAVAPQVGAPRVMAAAPEIMGAMGLPVQASP